ncbi:alpha/beta fold hydrolase [Massilia oculi]|uniref:alpha/beta fold hydrolase n=1 Tax=Massilia oculi TaxID=945844 RepID=UPI0028AF7CA6|nr:alpha/beta hydrolase [Massilia oculi]
MNLNNPFSRARARIFLLAAILFAACSLAQAATRHSTVTAPDGVTLAVQESGNPYGPAILFIHGLLGSHLNWDAQRASPALQGYRLISYDLRGHGLSGKPGGPAAYREGRRWADDLAAVIAATKAHKPVLVGWSLGAAVISNYLAAYGDAAIGGAVYVNGVVELTDTRQIVAHPDVYRDLNASDLGTRLDAQRAFLALCFHTRPDQGDFERLLGAAAMASWDMQAAVHSMDVSLRGLAAARAPVLLLYGARDALVHAAPTMARGRQINARIGQAVYAESGHAPFVEEPERFARDLARFVQSASRQGESGG